MMILNIGLTNDVNLELYKDDRFSKLFNRINLMSKRDLVNIEKLLEENCFEVTSYTRNTVWGKEIIYLPFTNKLFKIIHTTINDTSLQLHPQKSEEWYPLKESNIFDGNGWIKVNVGESVYIPPNSVHCMQKNAIVFEVQDNNLFDKNETLKIYDINGREINDKTGYYKYVLPSIKNKLIIKKNIALPCIDDRFNYFLFIIDGHVKNKLGYKFNAQTLYYINKRIVNSLKFEGNLVLIPAEYYTYFWVNYENN